MPNKLAATWLGDSQLRNVLFGPV